MVGTPGRLSPTALRLFRSAMRCSMIKSGRKYAGISTSGMWDIGAVVTPPVKPER
jgi:hypothetical protein